MNTKITITANGNIAPNKVIDLGFKYENSNLKDFYLH